MNFNNDPKQTVGTFTLLKKYSGFIAFLEVAESNAKVLRQAILSGTEDEDTIKAKRQKLHAYEEIMGIPDHMIALYSPKEEMPTNDDPY